MDAKLEPIKNDADFSMTRGGPLHSRLWAARILQGQPTDVVRASALFICLLWLPVILLGIPSWLRDGAVPLLLRDPSVHVRFWVSVPLLFAGELMLDARCAIAVEPFTRGDLSDDCSRVRAILDQAVRYRNATSPEGLLLAVGLLLGQWLFWRETGASGVFTARNQGAPISLSLLWYCFVSLPFFQFLTLRWLYRWLLWCMVLYRLSRARLRLVASHPDRVGGLALTAEPVAAFAIYVLALNVVLATTWADEIIRRGKTLEEYIPAFVATALLTILLALGPLFTFTQALVRTRLAGVRQYGDFAYDYCRRFHARWIRDSEPDNPLGNDDIQSLADLGTAFERIAKMRFVPFGPVAAIWLVLCVVAPALPLLATQVPPSQIFTHIVRAVLGG